MTKRDLLALLDHLDDSAEVLVLDTDRMRYVAPVATLRTVGLRVVLAIEPQSVAAEFPV